MGKKIGLLTGGGDCPGLNSAIRGCVYNAIQHGYECIGFQNGWKGVIKSDYLPLDISHVKNIISQGGTILGTSRTNPFQIGVENQCVQNFKSLELDALVAIGGEDTLGVATKLFQNFNLPVIGIPKTMDNDLYATDYTFGFDTATTVAVDAAMRLKDTGLSHRRVMVLEVMGRHAGWVALFTAIASGADWVCLPERKIDKEKMIHHVKSVYEKNRTVLVICSEAVELPDQHYTDESLDAFGHMTLKNRDVGVALSKLIEKESKIETRSATIGHIQRGGSPTLFDRILGTRTGVKAFDLVLQRHFGQMVVLKGDRISSVSLQEATSQLKKVSEEWMHLFDTVC